jgi:hypothetical protein
MQSKSSQKIVFELRGAELKLGRCRCPLQQLSKFMAIRILLSAIAMIVAFPLAAIAQPLQVGVYGIGSRYIQIATQGKRICYQGFSIRRAITASVIPEKNGFYQIHGFTGRYLIQKDDKTLLAGEKFNLNSYEAIPDFSREVSGDLQQCLDSNKPFFKQIVGRQ